MCLVALNTGGKKITLLLTTLLFDLDGRLQDLISFSGPVSEDTFCSVIFQFKRRLRFLEQIVLDRSTPVPTPLNQQFNKFVVERLSD